MRFKDVFLVAFRNLSAGKSMVRKMIFSMSFIVMIIISYVIIVDSYYRYQDEFNRNHLADCYYYTEFRDVPLTDIAELSAESSERKNEYNAADSLLLASVQWKDNEDYIAANELIITVDGTEHTVNPVSSFRNKYYQNISMRTSVISLGVYERGTKLFTDGMIRKYDAPFMIGEYPDDPGEIMMDNYILSVFGIKEIDESIIGSIISIKRNTDGEETTLVDNYRLTGIFENEMLAVRESAYALDLHLEHIYVNYRTEDSTGLRVCYGSVRYYFDNYSDYTMNCEYADSILTLYIDDVYSGQDGDTILTPKGLEYCLLYWIIENVGRLLIILSAVIGVIVTFSLLYVFRFYCDRNAAYIKMLHNIGMTKKNRMTILSVEMSISVAGATVIGVYSSALFLLLLNMIMRFMPDFSISFNIPLCCSAIVSSWIYFALCFVLSVRRTERRNTV